MSFPVNPEAIFLDFHSPSDVCRARYHGEQRLAEDKQKQQKSQPLPVDSIDLVDIEFKYRQPYFKLR